MASQRETVGVASGLLFLVMIAAAIIGWVLNIVTIAHSTGEISGMLVLRVIGIFVAPLGSILGYC